MDNGKRGKWNFGKLTRTAFCVLVAAMMFATFKGGAKLRSPNGEATSCRFSNEGNGAANDNPEGNDVAAIWSIAVDSGTASATTEPGVHLTLHRPATGSDSVETVTLCACTDLVEGDWFALSNTVFAAGETNLAIHVPSAQLADHSISNRCFFSFFTSGDTDNDGLEDWYELLISHTDPNDADTDGDRIPDGWELAHGLDPLSGSDATEDDDNDGVINWHEWMFGSDPHSGDTDGDHISDLIEIENGTNPASADTDNDGLDDDYELANDLDPNNGDTDGDGLPDGWEVDNDLNPNDPDGDNGASGDPDGDGVSNLDEYLNGANPRSGDTDGDNVSDAVEIAQRSNPNDVSDGGVAPSTDDFRELSFTIGSFGTTWELTIEGLGPEDTRVQKIVTNGWYQVRHSLRKGNSYRLSMHWLHDNREYVDYEDVYYDYIDLLVRNNHCYFEGLCWDLNGSDYGWQLRINNLPESPSFEDYTANRLSGNELVIGNGWVAENESGLLTSSVRENDVDYLGRGVGNVAEGKTATLYVLGDPKVIPDYDRNGEIDEDDESIYNRNRTTFRFWINDDNDSGDVNDSENDRPGSGSNGQDDRVNGRGDLLDFTPVLLDVSGVFPPGTPDSFKERVSWKLQSGVVNAVWTSLSASNAGKFQRTDYGATFGPNLSQNAHEATVTSLSTGAPLPDAFVQTMEANDGRGVVMIEGCGIGHSLCLQAYVGESLVPLMEGMLYIEVSSVEDMYRFVTLRGAHNNSNFTVDIPGRPRNIMDNCKDLDVYFTHGFNVSESEAHAWGSEVFKRLWQSGANTRFWAFTWSGDYNVLGSLFNGLHYQQDVYNALVTGTALKTFLENTQVDSSKRILMTQSLGNMVACEALRLGLQVKKYFMFNAAIASETVDAALQNLNNTIKSKYVPVDWHDYNAMSWAANWFRWFQDDTTDSRGKIGWPGYFSTAIGNVQSIYNYYSTGDEVFAETSNTPWALEGMSVSFANYAWQKQEVLKGSGGPGGTAYGGWCFHSWIMHELEIGIGGVSQYVDKTYKYSASEANAMVSDGAVTNNPVFNRDANEMFNRNATINDQRLCLAKYVPAVSSAIGKTAPRSDVINSIDLNGFTFRNGWGRSHPTFGDAWFHSDMKDMAYFYVYKLYNDIVDTKGELR